MSVCVCVFVDNLFFFFPDFWQCLALLVFKWRKKGSIQYTVYVDHSSHFRKSYIYMHKNLFKKIKILLQYSYTRGEIRNLTNMLNPLGTLN